MSAEAAIPHSRPWIDQSDRTAVDAVLRSGLIAQGRQVEKFEAKVASYGGAAGGVATASGTSALALALRAVGARAGAEVVLPTYVCGNALQAIRQTGATPILCDVGEFWNMTPATVRPRITKKTAAIVAVHTFGTRCDIGGLAALGVPVVEDACQRFTREHGGRPSHAAATVYSFHATKCLATGEGGMVVAVDAKLVEAARRLRDGTGRALEDRLGPPMSDLQAALGLSQLARYGRFLKIRRALAQRYRDAFPALLTSALAACESGNIFFRFPLYGEQIRPARAIAELKKRGVACRRGVDTLLHQELGLADTKFPNAVRRFNHTLSVPLYPSLDAREQSRAIAETMKYLKSVHR